jgi:predicted nucleic acid-binding protein
MSIIRLPVKAILDTSVYIPFINKGISHPVVEMQAGKPTLYMSAVVMEELYAGALDAVSIKLLDKLYEVYEKLGRLVAPSTADWQKAGKIVSKLGKKYGFEQRYLTRMQNDTLIALCARQIGAYLVTQNTTDFLRIKEFLDYKLYPEK